MALPKKKSSKSRTRRRFSQYSYNKREKLMRLVDKLMHMGKPFIYDASARKKVKAEKKIEESKTNEVKEELEKKPKIQKVDKIEVPTEKAKKKEVKEDKKEESKEVEKKTEKKEDKGKWYSNMFSQKGQDKNNYKDVSGGSKKIHRRKSI